MGRARASKPSSKTSERDLRALQRHRLRSSGPASISSLENTILSGPKYRERSPYAEKQPSRRKRSNSQYQMPRTTASTAATERGTQTPTNSSPKEPASASSHERSFTRNGSMQSRKANGRFGRKIKSKEELENQELKANAVESKEGVCSANTEHWMMAMAATPDETRPSGKRKKPTLSASIKGNTLDLERLSTIMSERVRKTDEAREGDAILERMTKLSVDGRLPGPILRTTPGPSLSGKRVYPVCTSLSSDSGLSSAKSSQCPTTPSTVGKDNQGNGSNRNTEFPVDRASEDELNHISCVPQDNYGPLIRKLETPSVPSVMAEYKFAIDSNCYSAGTTEEPADCIKDGNQNESMERPIECPPKSPLFTINKDNAGFDKDIELTSANKEKVDSMENATHFSDPLVKIATVRTEIVDRALCENAQTQGGPNFPLTQAPAQVVEPGTQDGDHNMEITPATRGTSARRDYIHRGRVTESKVSDHGLESEASLWKQFFNFDSSTDEE